MTTLLQVFFLVQFHPPIIQNGSKYFVPPSPLFQSLEIAVQLANFQRKMYSFISFISLIILSVVHVLHCHILTVAVLQLTLVLLLLFTRKRTSM